ncbi:MAG: amidohydrolase family protein [Victivallales bacterium]|nr:amidohydrolase family protein [Victivallales bacterium]
MQEFSILIKNARVVDGSGKPAYSGGVYFSGGVVRAVGKVRGLSGVEPDMVIDAQGALVCPGFIDTHSHSDISLLAVPGAEGRLAQGICTEITGNCGLSAFPVTDLNREHLSGLYATYGVDISWHSYAEYREVLAARSPGVNVFSLCGYNTLRAAAAGYGTRCLSRTHIDTMKHYLYESLMAGASGVSTGLLYVPGKFATDAELADVLSVAGACNSIYSTHLRSEGAHLVRAVAEALRVSRWAGINKLHISHLKTAGKSNWHKLPLVLSMIDEARRSGLNVTADRYPYIESMSSLTVVLPPPYDDMDDLTLMNLLSAPDKRLELERVLEEYPDERWSTVRLVSTALPEYADFQGSIMEWIAQALDMSPAQVVADIVSRDPVNAMAAYRGMCPDNLRCVLEQEYTMCGSDESARPTDYSLGRSHPRGFGTFPEFFNLLKGTLPLEKIIHKMTGLPASVFGLTNRGLLSPGYAADIVIMEPDEFKAGADFAHPHRLASGVRQVYVNGLLRYSKGEGA